MPSAGRPASVEQRRRDVDQARGAGDPRAAALAARQLHDPRHMQRFAVQQEAVLGLAVIAESFAVVGDDDHDRAIEDAARGKPIEKAAHELVRVGDLAVVGLRHRVRRRRRVRRVRLVEVQEREQRLAGVRIDPRRQRVHRARAVALRVRERLPVPAIVSASS